MSQPPDFEKKPNCYKCGVNFGLITRQHHCRNCGKSVCDKCSSKNVPLPHFAISENVRVCDNCYSTLTAPKAAPKPVEPSPSSSSSSSSNSSTAAAPVEVKSKRVAVCKCGLPVCICPPDREEKAAPAASATKSVSQTASSSSSSSSKPVSKSTFTPSSGFGFGQFSSSANARKWDLKGNLDEQCREAIKYGDDAGALLLLKNGANPKFIDHTGNSLLHLAAMFDRGDIVKDLLARNADVKVKNASGETPIDVAPIALQHKIREIIAAGKE